MEDSLLCLENSSICFEGSPLREHKNPNFINQCLINYNGSEPLVGFLVLSDEAVQFLVERQREHLPRADYLNRMLGGDLDSSVRKEAVDWIWKAHAYHGFGPSCFCLSVNYLDRFLSVHEFAEDKAWSVPLLAIACLSIAAKMEESEVPKSVDLQVGEPKLRFEARAIQRMELMVLSKLGWRMQALTPCSFMEYFLGKMTCEQYPAESSFISTSSELILNMIKCIDFLEFNPSEIAAAVAISVSRELQGKEIGDALTCFAILEKDRVLKCLDLIRDLSLINVPTNLEVLDDECLSSETDGSTIGYAYNNSLPNIPNAKRHKSEGPSFHDGSF